MDYVPMSGPMPGERHIPSNGTEGWAFIEDWCSRCERDKELSGTKHPEDCGDDDWCPIVAASYRDEAVEWRELEDGSTKCMAFAPLGHGVPPPRCENTADMFDGIEAVGA
jgi:hypothetical protein